MLGYEGGDTWNFGDKAFQAAKLQGKGRGWKMTVPPAQAGTNQRTPARRPAPRPAEGRVDR